MIGCKKNNITTEENYNGQYNNSITSVDYSGGKDTVNEQLQEDVKLKHTTNIFEGSGDTIKVFYTGVWYGGNTQSDSVKFYFERRNADSTIYQTQLAQGYGTLIKFPKTNKMSFTIYAWSNTMWNTEGFLGDKR